MKQDYNSPLTVYKASAGSGKTFTLASEFITLLVKNPQSYRNILAVTFTNKATEEMKMRIISQLYGIWHGLDDSEAYAKRISEATGMGRRQISERAGEALRLLIHNYSYFRVETIDSFFQRVLRNLARELDLAANMRVELNDYQVEENAVDEMIDQLKRNDQVLRWILKYIMENIDEDRSWNIIGQIKSFGRTIFRDYYKAESKKLGETVGDSNFFDLFAKRMNVLKQDALARMKETADRFIDVLDEEGLTVDDLSYGRSGVAAFFLKMQNGTADESIVGSRVTDAACNAAKWCKKTHPRAAEIAAIAENRLIPMLQDAMSERASLWRQYKSAELTQRHLHQLRLLGSIEQKVRELNDGANRFLLSDTQQLLHELIKDSDSPFVFERIGARLEHIMIDEFQDTSTVQWQNFRILLNECMSHSGTHNLIVGDVKQSIYRWRSGDWRLLNDIRGQFSNAENMLTIRTLDTNYRSSANIVTFNNRFFHLAAQAEEDSWQLNNPEGAGQLGAAYADVMQNIPEGRPAEGTVEIRLIASDDYEQQTLDYVTGTVGKMLAAGIRQSDIAILVRTNKHIPLIASHLAAVMPDVSVVSDEAYRLDASPAVQMLTEGLRFLAHPDDVLAKATLAKLYQRNVLGNGVGDGEMLLRDRQLSDLLPKELTDDTDGLNRMPIYEKAERLYTILGIERMAGQSAYVCTFYDQLTKFSIDSTTDTDSFLKEWDESICSKTIQSDEMDGIRILSIHKSKGLEYDSVIIPFCDWRLEHADILWCKPDEAPFNAMPIVPIDYSEKQMKGTVYEKDYYREHMQNTVDNLNLLYVAFTRARRNLFVSGRRKASGTRSALIEQVLPELGLEGSTLTGTANAEADMTFCYGEGELHPAKAAGSQGKSSRNVLLQAVEPLNIHISTFANKTEFKQSNNSRKFIDGEDETTDNKYIKTGCILHQIFSEIKTVSDIESALHRLVSEGVLYDSDMTSEELAGILRRRLSNPTVAEWFNGKWTLFSECSILTTDNDGNVVTRRPDRVMTDGGRTIVVDFKFGHPHKEHRIQVEEYISLLRSMGYTHVEGRLWYVMDDKVVNV